MNRHGDGRPAAARWYQWTAAIRRRAVGELPAPAAGSWRASFPDRTPVRGTTVRRRLVARRTGTDPRGAADAAAGAGCATADGRGCASRPGRRRGRWQTPPEAARREDRVRTCTTAHRRERASRLGSVDRMRLARAGDRSSGQTGSTLGAARLQDGTPGAGAHPSTEPVLLGTLQIVRLKGALHRRPPGMGTDSSDRGNGGCGPACVNPRAARQAGTAPERPRLRGRHRALQRPAIDREQAGLPHRGPLNASFRRHSPFMDLRPEQVRCTSNRRLWETLLAFRVLSIGQRSLYTECGQSCGQPRGVDQGGAGE